MVRTQFVKYWNRVRSSFWFVPTAMVLALVGVALNERATDWLSRNLDWTFTAGAEGANAVLGVIAGSMITIAGVVFCMTLVALSLTSSQLGPRLLRTFMRDTSTQVVLGTFIATFVYCLLVLGTIRRGEDVEFVPHLSVGLGVVLAVASVWVLIYFIHHVAVSIQANEIAARISKELVGKIDHLFPSHIGQGGPRITGDPPDAALISAFNRECQAVPANEDRYLQIIDGDALMALAIEEGLVFQLERKCGNFVVAGGPLVLVWPGNRVTDQLTSQRPVHGDCLCGSPRFCVVSSGGPRDAAALAL